MASFLMMADQNPSEARPSLQRVAFSQLPAWERDDLGLALATFQRSCQKLLQADQGDFPQIKFAGKQQDWVPTCLAAQNTSDPRSFFEANFIPYQIYDSGRPQGLFTGYFEPEVDGSLEKSEEYSVPLYAKPPDLVELPKKTQKRLKVKYGHWLKGKAKAYFTRKEIEEGALKDKGLELIWLKNWVDAFFIHIQGSSRVRLPDGKIIHLTFAAKSGLPYTSIGAVLVEKGEMVKETVSMQKIRQWLFENPQAARLVMWANSSFIFFRIMPGNAQNLGAEGAQKVPLTPRRSLAVDRTIWMFGTPVWLETTVPTELGSIKDFHHLLIAQDTGSAIRGLARGDVYWGWGEEAAFAAGHMKQPGKMTVLLPIALAKRLQLP